jgi:cell division protein FtsB
MHWECLAMKQPRRRMRYLTLLVLLALIGVAFSMGNHKIQATTQNLAKEEDQSRLELAALQNEKQDLETELSAAGTDAYIENEARTRYGYLKPGELRFVITNPEALYGDGAQEPQLQVVGEGDKP